VKRKISRLGKIHSHEEQLAVIKDSVKTAKFTVNRVDSKNNIRLKNVCPNTTKIQFCQPAVMGEKFQNIKSVPFKTVLQ
jgi:UDP-N-acetylglucosamine enolpyruvyl transferase